MTAAVARALALAMSAACLAGCGDSSANTVVTPKSTPADAAADSKQLESSEEVVETTPSRPRDITFDDLKFDIEKDAPFKRAMLTDEIEALHARPIRIRGYILPSFLQTGIKQFVLVRDNMECCFGPGAALYDAIYVEMAEGKSTDFEIRPVTVSGEFHVREWVTDGRHLAIYHMLADEVE